MNDKDLLRFWGKTDPPHALVHHQIDAGCVAIALLETPTFRPVLDKMASVLNVGATVLRSWIAYLTALHDIGKCSPDFQGKGGTALTIPIKELGLQFRRHPVDGIFHSNVSGAWALTCLRDAFGWGTGSSIIVDQCIEGHHGHFSTRHVIEDGVDRAWNRWKNRINDVIVSVFKPLPWQPTNFPRPNVIGTLLVAIMVVSDWIASRTESKFHEIKDKDGISFREYATRSLARARTIVDLFGFNDALHVAPISRFHDAYPDFNALFPIQAITDRVVVDLASHGTMNDVSLVILEAPTGEGKTEASHFIMTQLMKHVGLNGMYMALPTCATSNQMFGRVKLFFKHLNKALPRARGGVSIVHGMAWLVDDREPRPRDILHTLKDSTASIEDVQNAIAWFRPSRLAFLAPHGVGTVDQLMMGALYVKFGFLRLLGMAGKVIIVDEVHAYDAYMTSILTRILEWGRVMNVPVILLSATLPSEKKRHLIEACTGTKAKAESDHELHDPYPLVTMVLRDGRVIRESSRDDEPLPRKIINVDVDIDPTELPALAERVIASASSEKCTCVIVNTVNQAQSLHDALSTMLREKNVPITPLVFHARFTAKDRNAIEKRVTDLFGRDGKHRPRSAIVIATQVIEQSLDVDFDEMFSEIAPMDLLIQRIGRLHRHDRDDRHYTPTCHVVHFEDDRHDFGSSEHVYAPFILQKTFVELLSMKELHVPNDVRNVIERVYDGTIPSSLPPQISKASMQGNKEAWTRNVEKMEHESGTYLIPDVNATRFTYASFRDHVFEESDGDIEKYVHAKTRYGMMERQFIVLDEKEFVGTEHRDKDDQPEKIEKRKILLRTIALPWYWFRGISQHGTFQLPTRDKQSWLRTPVLRMRNGTWACNTPRGVMTLRYDEVKGMTMNLPHAGGGVSAISHSNIT